MSWRGEALPDHVPGFVFCCLKGSLLESLSGLLFQLLDPTMWVQNLFGAKLLNLFADQYNKGVICNS